MLTNKQMENFAELAVRIGANMQKGQEVVIRCDVNCADFAHLIAEKAYQFGAKRVLMQWRDEILGRINMLNASKETLCEVPDYQVAQAQYFIDHKCCLISISAGNPNIYKGCDPDKIAAANIASSKAMVNFSGSYFHVVPYGVNDEGFIDYDKVEEIALECKPKMIIAGASAYARTIDFKRFREIADKVDAVLMVDMAHIAGLVAAGLHPSPIPYAHVTTTTTHKTLRGPRGGMILCSQEMQDKYNFNKAIFPGIQGGPLMHVIAAKAVCFKEAMSEEFKAYQRQTVKNAAVLADTLSSGGIRIVSGGTDNHLMLADTMSLGRTGNEVQELLDRAHITANKNSIPFDTQSVRLTSGTPAVTTRGMGEDEMREIGRMLVDVINRGEDAVEDVKQQALMLCERFPLYPEIEM